MTVFTLAAAVLGGCADGPMTAPGGSDALALRKQQQNSPAPSGPACEIMNFNQYNHGDYVSAVLLPMLGLTLNVDAVAYEQGGGPIPGRARAFDTDHVSTSANEGTDMEWNGAFARCASCRGLETALMIQRPHTSAVLDNNFGGEVTFTGFPAGQFFVRSITIIDNDTPPPVLLKVDGHVVAQSVPARDGNVQTVALPVAPIASRFSIERGTVAPDYVIASGSSDNIEVCRLVTGECDGKVSRLTLRYTGTTPARVQVLQGRVRNANSNRSDAPIIYDAVVQPGGLFTIVGTDKQATLGPEITLFVNGAVNTTMHTSCSQPIGPGLVRGSFVVVSGESRNGGALPPVAPNAQD